MPKQSRCDVKQTITLLITDVSVIQQTSRFFIDRKYATGCRYPVHGRKQTIVAITRITRFQSECVVYGQLGNRFGA